jgi:hypothetical protein
VQGEALINDKINWLALFFAIYSVSPTAPAAVIHHHITRQLQLQHLLYFAQVLITCYAQHR